MHSEASNEVATLSFRRRPAPCSPRGRHRDDAAPVTVILKLVAVPEREGPAPRPSRAGVAVRAKGFQPAGVAAPEPLGAALLDGRSAAPPGGVMGSGSGSGSDGVGSEPPSAS